MDRTPGDKRDPLIMDTTPGGPNITRPGHTNIRLINILHLKGNISVLIYPPLLLPLLLLLGIEAWIIGAVVMTTKDLTLRYVDIK